MIRDFGFIFFLLLPLPSWGTHRSSSAALSQETGILNRVYVINIIAMSLLSG